MKLLVDRSIHRIINNLLSLVVVGLALVILVLPYLPQVSWWAGHNAPLISSAKPQEAPTQIPKDNTLFIPKLGLTEIINEGQSLDTVDKGVWRLPQTSTPLLASNTVLVGHRFTYRGASVFYHLDKLTVGDVITTYWQGKTFNYRIVSSSVVPPTELVVEAPTDQPTLTLYTCTPLLTAQDRLVIRAILEGSL